MGWPGHFGLSGAKRRLYFVRRRSLANLFEAYLSLCAFVIYTLNNTYTEVCTYNWAHISINTGKIIFKFSTNIDDMCVIKFRLLYFE